MNRSRLLMIGILALAVGLMTSYIVYGRLRSAPNAGAEPGVEVVVAAHDLAVGSKLEDRDLLVVRYPKTDLPSNFFAKRSEIVGRGVVMPVSKGEFLIQSKLAPVNAGAGLPSLIPTG